MAKKTVATLHEGSKDGRAYTKVIKMVKSPKTGAYIFDEQMVPNKERLHVKMQPLFLRFHRKFVILPQNCARAHVIIKKYGNIWLF